MKKTILAILFFLETLIGYGQKKPTMKANDIEQQSQIIALHTKIYESILQKQKQYMETSLHEKFIFTTADAELMNKSAFIDGFAMNLEIKFTVLKTSEETVIISGKTVVLTALAHITIAKGNQSRDLQERVTETYVQKNGIWKLLAFQATYLKQK